MIFSKSRSRCGASTIFKGRTLPNPERESDRHRQEKSTRICSDAVSGRTFSTLDSFLLDFWVPVGSAGANFRSTFATCWTLFGALVVFLRSRVLGEGVGIDFVASWGPPGKNFESFFGDSPRRFGHAWRPESVPSLTKFCPKFGSVCRSSLAFPSQLAHTFS